MTRRVIGTLIRVWQSVRVASAGHVAECTDSNRRRLAKVTLGCTSTRTNEPTQTRRPTLPTSATSTTPDTARPAVKDNLGKRIEYVSHNAGAKITQDDKHPSGLLTRTLSPSIDALGCAQQTTGRK
jgi:hypothetical protein